MDTCYWYCFVMNKTILWKDRKMFRKTIYVLLKMLSLQFHLGLRAANSLKGVQSTMPGPGRRSTIPPFPKATFSAIFEFSNAQKCFHILMPIVNQKAAIWLLSLSFVRAYGEGAFELASANTPMTSLSKSQTKSQVTFHQWWRSFQLFVVFHFPCLCSWMPLESARIIGCTAQKWLSAS